MGAFATWIAALVSNIFAAFGVVVTKKTLFATAAIATCVALTLAMIAAIKVAMLAVVVIMPVWMQPGVCMLPTNIPACLGLLIAARTGRFIYDWNMTNLKLASYIT